MEASQLLSDAAIEDLVSLAESLPNPLSFLMGSMIGGAASRIAPDATALGQREVGFEFRLIAVWPPEDSDAAQHIAWAHQGWERLRVYGNGRAYPTFLSDAGLAGVRAAYHRERRTERQRVPLPGTADPSSNVWMVR